MLPDELGLAGRRLPLEQSKEQMNGTKNVFLWLQAPPDAHYIVTDSLTLLA